jgi:hypothetical protein
MENDMPENWELWDWSIQEHLENSKLPSIFLDFVYRTPGLKALNTSVSTTFYEKKDKDKCDAFYAKIVEKEDVLKTLETKESIGYIFYQKDKQKGNQKDMIDYLLTFFGEQASEMQFKVSL